MDSDVKVGYVYWIHKPEHTDIFTEGYVGITSKTVSKRYRQHVAAAKTKAKDYPIYKAILKYGDLLIVDTIVIASMDYCAELEFKLRPHEGIGYNVLKGGYINPLLGRMAYKTPEDIRLKQSLIKLGKKASDITKQRMRDSRKNVPSWDNSKADKFVWAIADEIYKLMNDGGIQRRCDLSRVLNIEPSKLKSIFNKIKSGWIPIEDQKWLHFHSEYKLNNIEVIKL